MKNLLENCERHFHTDNLYEVLGVKIDASKQEIKKGYHKKSLIFHPDRDTQDKAEATIKFQILGQVYNILSDDARRAEYDETGAVDEASVEQDRNWEQYWRLLFPKITLKDIEEFAVKYRGSDEETEDLKAIYLSSQGDMDTIMSNMMYSTFEDEDRYSTLLKKLIKGGQLPDYKAFSKESKKKKEKRSKKAQHEAEEAEKEAKKLKLDGSEDSLIAAIRSKSRLQQSESFLSQLEAKYSKATSDKPGSKSTAKSGNKSMKGAKRKKKI
ncbi:dnaJ subfamily C member 9 [Biomphalaria glabrata]|uniref:DnaJ homolog subfamily C member 9-like n=1 Tax=Biomphalaria glabrata TaxID=6526 RepID=A0A2C9JEM1_BIOGL|nr:dnaJ homolog subfamily C member 9-like [Biomphalaria glabrata]